MPLFPSLHVAPGFPSRQLAVDIFFVDRDLKFSSSKCWMAFKKTQHQRVMGLDETLCLDNNVQLSCTDILPLKISLAISLQKSKCKNLQPSFAPRYSHFFLYCTLDHLFEVLNQNRFFLMCSFVDRKSDPAAVYFSLCESDFVKLLHKLPQTRVFFNMGVISIKMRRLIVNFFSLKIVFIRLRGYFYIPSIESQSWIIQARFPEW